MKKLLTICFLLATTFTVNAQEIEGTWIFEKMNFFGNIIYFDGTSEDKQNVLDSWIKMSYDDVSQTEKDELKKNINKLYMVAKKLFKSKIEFKNLEFNLYTEWTLGKMKFNNQKDDEKFEIKEVDIRIINYLKFGYSFITFPNYDDFNGYDKIKITQNANKLIFECSHEAIEDKKVKNGKFIIYYGR